MAELNGLKQFAGSEDDNDEFEITSIADLIKNNRQLKAALNTMSQGLCMFDADQRLIVCNEQYAKLFRLPVELMRPGITLHEVLKYRVERGLYGGTDPEAFIRSRMAVVAENKAFKDLLEMNDGSVFAVSHVPTPDGGWLSTFEDITERIRIEVELAHTRAALDDAWTRAEQSAQQARTADARLLAALDVVPEGFALFDAEDRYVLWNKAYRDLYTHSEDQIAVGKKFEDALREGLARGQYVEAVGREEGWLSERLARHALPQSVHEQHLPGDRWVRVVEQRTADGGSIGIRTDITELKRREASFRLLFDGNPVPMWVFDRESLRFLAVNQAACDHYGYSAEQFMKMDLLDIRPAEDAEEIRRIATTSEGKFHTGRSWRHIKADGDIIDVLVFSQSLCFEDRDAAMVAIVDVTLSKRAEDARRRTQEFLDTVIESMPSMLVVKDPHEHRYMLVNRAGEQLLGIAREDMIGKSDHDLFPEEEASLSRAVEQEVLQGDRFQVTTEEAILTRHNGFRDVAMQRLAIFDEAGRPKYLLTVGEDITERKRAAESIAHLASHDALTDLPNRLAFADHLASSIERARATGESFAVLCLDLDQFKEVNDIFGHSVGDELLRAVAQRLLRASPGAFLARVGGDEFTLIVCDVQRPTAALAAAEYLLGAMADDFDIDGRTLRVGLSIGAAIFPNHGGDATSLLGNADAALYRAKADGRGVFRLFEPGMDKKLRERRALQMDLRGAIERHELMLHYQPQALISGETTGFEVLVRWRHPERGMVSPGMFIPVAEDSGLIGPIGEWILREACREAASWARPMQVAVNLSPVQFRHGDLAGLVHEILLQTGLPARRLELEITEGVLIDDFSRAISVLRRLKSLGVRIAMDDFGTGYSSLSYLQSFPFDKIKIDQSFVSQVETNPQSAPIIRAVIGLGHALQVPVIAEGVETKDQLEFLRAEGCDEVQGYFIGRPSPIEAYAGLVGRQNEGPTALACSG